MFTVESVFQWEPQVPFFVLFRFVKCFAIEQNFTARNYLRFVRITFVLFLVCVCVLSLSFVFCKTYQKIIPHWNEHFVGRIKQRWMWFRLHTLNFFHSFHILSVSLSLSFANNLPILLHILSYFDHNGNQNGKTK